MLVWTAQPIGCTPALSVTHKRRLSCDIRLVALHKCYIHLLLPYSLLAYLQHGGVFYCRQNDVTVTPCIRKRCTSYRVLQVPTLYSSNFLPCHLLESRHRTVPFGVHFLLSCREQLSALGTNHAPGQNVVHILLFTSQLFCTSESHSDYPNVFCTPYGRDFPKVA